MNIIPEKYAPQAQAVLRIIVGLLFLQHGLAKLVDFPHMEALNQMPTGLKWAAGVIEALGGIALVVGFQARLAAFVLSGFAAVAYFMVHAPMGFFPALNYGEPAILFCFAALFLSVSGPGAWSLDHANAAAA